MNLPMRFRFSERDYVYNLTMLSTDYITEEQVNIDILNEFDWQDITFIIKETPTGFETTFIDNNSEQEITLDDLTTPSYDFFIRKIEDLSYSRVQNEIHKIKMILNSTISNGGSNDRIRKTNSNNRNTDNRLEKIAQ